MLVYLSGQMTGLSEHNLPEFARCTARLRELGFDVLNPGETAGSVTHLPRSTYMYIDTAYVQAADAIVVMKTWYLSKGSKLEMILAVSHGKQIHEYDETVGLGARIELVDWTLDAHYATDPENLSLVAQGIHE